MNPSIKARISALDWPRLARELDAEGYATTGPILTADECAELIALYPERERFRSRVDMARLRYGVGEYKYFARPLPKLVEQLRGAFYTRLAPIANRWSKLLDDAEPYPASLSAFVEACAAVGQTRPTPLLLRYETGGYNCLHQDLYGDIAFPLQFTCVLSRRDKDFDGGEFLLVEQRPRAQSRGEAISLDLGEGIIFTNRYRPVAGARGHYRVNVRHGVSTLRRGERYALGIIFHDAK
ncbi:MAG TPA: 2OG-Fe(II) oxygenase [Candidatus Binataceae bacterium]|nr:2OG-Fe(II) oxygenase [Candidatus Binataceae bacterium]